MKWVVDDWWLASSFKDFMRSIDTRKNLFHVWCQSEKFENTIVFFLSIIYLFSPFIRLPMRFVLRSLGLA